MKRELQPYLPGLSPKEAAPFKGSEHLTVEQVEMDYYIYLTPAGAKKACEFLRLGAVSIFNKVEAAFETPNGDNKILGLTTTFDAMIFQDSNCHNKIYFNKDKEGPWVVVARWMIGQLLSGESDHLMTRYDGHTNKIWIRLQDPVAVKNSA